MPGRTHHYWRLPGAVGTFAGGIGREEKSPLGRALPPDECLRRWKDGPGRFRDQARRGDPTERCLSHRRGVGGRAREQLGNPTRRGYEDRKSTRLNSSHANISYAVFCLKKKNSLST